MIGWLWDLAETLEDRNQELLAKGTTERSPSVWSRF